MTLLKSAIAAGLLTLASLQSALAVDIQKVTSPGGITALLVEDYTVPLIAMSFAFEGGSTEDAAGKEGTAELLTTMLDEGAGELDSQALQRALDDNGMSYSFDAGSDAFEGSIKTIAEDSERSFELLKSMLTEPRFDAEPLGRMQAALVTRLRRAETAPDAIAGKALREAIFGDHPYGRPSRGTKESIAAITAEDLNAYRQRVFAQDNLVVGVVGAISQEELKLVLDKVFGVLPENADLVDVPEVSVTTGPDRHIELDVPQTSISLAMPGIKRDDEDFYTAYLVNYVLGGGSFSSRLYTEVREKRGLAYGVGTYLSMRDHGGIVGGGSGTRADRAQETIDVIQEEITRMAEEGPTAEELDKAKRYIIGSYAIGNLDTSTKIANVLVAIQQSDLGIDYIDRRADYIGNVTLEDAKRVAKELYSADPTIVTVGRPLETAPAN